jgi:RimJ/RimL family protein N-acetyltransferase
MEKEDVDFLFECFNDIDFWGAYDPIVEQRSKSELMQRFDNPSDLKNLTERKRFIIQKKDGSKIGFIGHWVTQPNRWMEIGYNIITKERGKGYGTEAVQLIVDYLFLSQNISRIQALTDVRNKTSQKLLEKTGFKKEGTIRKTAFSRGEWTDAHIYSILREEWKHPRLLTKTP